MKRLFICLANSRKYTQRCIAGIELARSSRKGYKYQLVKQDDNPVWIRPVSGRGHGEVSSELMDHINLLDVVEINVTAAIPQGYQSENVLFDNRRLEVIDRIDEREELIDKLLAVEEGSVLFGNRGRAVHIDHIKQLDYSLVLIKPTGIQVFETTSSAGNPQVRARFVYGTTSYDLPITDIDFIQKFNQNHDILQGCTHIYFTVSLGIEFNEYHYKLLAGIIYF